MWTRPRPAGPPGTLDRVSRRSNAIRPAAALATVALLGLTPGLAGAAGNPRRGNFSGQITIGAGRKLYLRCAGRGSPTVVMDSGIHDSSDPWTLTETEFPVPSSPSVFQGVARFTHVCIYDRPGTIRYTQPAALTARSTPVPMPRKLPNIASDLHKLLSAPDCARRSSSSPIRWPV